MPSLSVHFDSPESCPCACELSSASHLGMSPGIPTAVRGMNKNMSPRNYHATSRDLMGRGVASGGRHSEARFQSAREHASSAQPAQ